MRGVIRLTLKCCSSINVSNRANVSVPFTKVKDKKKCKKKEDALPHWNIVRYRESTYFK